jgi:GAF domain-containing protein/HAMP domain-containing protein
MSKEPKIKRSPRPRSLTATLAIAFVTLSLVALIVASGLELYFNFRAQQAVVAGEQRLTALEAANTVQDFIQERYGELEAAVKFNDLSSTTPAAVELTLEKMLGRQPAFRQLVWFDAEEQVIAQASRLSRLVSHITSQLEADLFAQTGQGARYISPAYIDDTTFEPLIVIAVPVKNIFGDFQGTLVAEVNLKFMWDLVDRLEIGEKGVAYVVDRQGKLLAFGDVTRVLAGENLSHLDEVAEFVGREEPLLELDEEGISVSTGINGTNIVSTYIPLGTPDWAVVIELPVLEAYRDILPNIIASGAIILIVAVLAAVVGTYLAQRLAAPLLNLTETATRIAGGDVELQAGTEGPAEVSQLAAAFNSMTEQLRGLIGSLEQRVVGRTQRLEIVASLGERLSAILNLEALLAEVVNRVKESFDYYHAHIYLLDDEQQCLVVAEGTGEAGAAMKTQGHNILLNARTSLVARAARSGEIVRVDNVREADDWLPNPLLPHTYSEMAVPIIIEGQVVGVLDVQQDRIAGLDEGDASLLRSLANQVGIAIRNARLFNEVETALAEARAAHERYIEQSWEKAKLRRRGAGQYHYARSEAPALSESALTEAKRLALSQDHPVIMTLNGGQDAGTKKRKKASLPNQQSIIAPITIRNKAIGALQLHPASEDQTWTEDDLAVVETVLDQLAQSAESLRLFEDTRERAGREQIIREITDKLRAAPNLERLVEIATTELGERLAAKYTQLELSIEKSSDNGNGQ